MSNLEPTYISQKKIYELDYTSDVGFFNITPT